MRSIAMLAEASGIRNKDKWEAFRGQVHCCPGRLLLFILKTSFKMPITPMPESISHKSWHPRIRYGKHQCPQSNRQLRPTKEISPDYSSIIDCSYQLNSIHLFHQICCQPRAGKALLSSPCYTEKQFKKERGRACLRKS